MCKALKINKYTGISFSNLINFYTCHSIGSSQSNSSGSIRSCTSIDNHNSHKQKKKTKTQLTHPAVDSARSATIGQASGGDVDANGKITDAGHAGHRPRRQSQDSQNRTHSQDSQNR